MALSDPIITIAGLAKFELPARTLYLSDGGMAKWGAETYSGGDDEFGTIESLELDREGTGDIAPGGRCTFLPATQTAAATLSAPDMQGSRLRFWLAEMDRATGLVSGTPWLIFDGLLDATILRHGLGTRKLDMLFMSRAERLFSVNRGNVCNTSFHSRVWPGELGFDNANGLNLTVAWGAKSPPRGTVATGVNVFGGIGGRPIDFAAYAATVRQV